MIALFNIVTMALLFVSNINASLYNEESDEPTEVCKCPPGRSMFYYAARPLDKQHFYCLRYGPPKVSARRFCGPERRGICVRPPNPEEDSPCLNPHDRTYCKYGFYGVKMFSLRERKVEVGCILGGSWLMEAPEVCPKSRPLLVCAHKRQIHRMHRKKRFQHRD